jgi:hypothetical protein
MAGFYADVPGPKLALDKDGTQWFKYTGAGVGTPLTSTEITQVNDWTDGGVDPGSGGWVAAVFPEKRDLAGVNVFANRSGVLNATLVVETSTNTTNGTDGAWTTAVTYTDAESKVSPAAQAGRTGIKTTATGGVKGIRVRMSSGNSFGPLTFHVFGKASAGQVVDRLAFWHPTLDQEVGGAYLDWGDVKRNTTETRTFRVKNLSATLTANSPRVAMEVLTDTTPSVVGQHALSADGTTWVSQVTMANLAPGAISPVLSVRRVTPLTAAPSLWSMRLFSEATTWS